MLLFVALFTIVVTGKPAVVQTTYGPVQGGRDLLSGVHYWKGVPFAAPPVGPLRWRAPTQPTSWTETRDATKFGHDCVQWGLQKGMAVDPSEDCLYLNVWAPPDARGLPVGVWFYGGSWSFGGTANALYDGERIVALQPNAVIVSVNYRLGALGFLASSTHNLTGNFGLLDQRQALRWVRDNIAAFGGDPNKVTIWGESAGSGSVSAHLLMEESWPLYNQAILESGPVAYWTARPISSYEAVFQYYLNSTGCASAPGSSLDCLREIAADKLMLPVDPVAEVLNSATNVAVWKAGNNSWGPCFDRSGGELPDIPVKLMQQGHFKHDVSIMLGTNRDEGTIFLGLPHDVSSEGYLSYLQSYFGPAIGKALFQTYPPRLFKNAWWAAARALGDLAMGCPARMMARTFANASISTYLYQFNHELDEARITDPWLGVCHGSELPFVFGVHDGVYRLPSIPYLPIIMSPSELELKDQIVKTWVAFIAGVPTVPRYNSTTDVSWDWNLKSQSVHGLKEAVCDVLDSFDLFAPLS